MITKYSNKIVFLFLTSIFIFYKSYNLSATEPPSELIIIDISQGEGRLAESGKEVAVHYEGWLFDTNIKTNDTFLV